MSTPSQSTPVRAVVESSPLRARSVGLALGGTFLVLACFVRFGLEREAFVGAFFAVVLLVLAVIDLERRIVPNRIVLPATAIVLVAQLAFFPDRALEWVLATIGVGLFFLLPLLVYPQGMGMGDVKLGMLIGAGLGATATNALLVGLLAAFIVAVAILVRRGRKARSETIAFAPFLVFGALVALFFA